VDGRGLLSEPVLVTGLGTLGAWGGGSDRLAAALAAGVPLTSEVDRSAGYHLPCGARRACLVPAGELAGWLSPAESRRMSPPSKLAVAASRMALRCAGLAEAGEAGTAVSIATAFGPSTNTEALLKQILFEGPEAASPSLFMESVANAPAARTASPRPWPQASPSPPISTARPATISTTAHAAPAWCPRESSPAGSRPPSPAA